LWQGIQNKVIRTLGTDHCSFNYKGQKELGKADFSLIPNGAPGVETRMALIYTYGVLTGKINMNEMVALTSTNAAKLFGLFPKKGTIAVGSDADIILWDPSVESVIQAKGQMQKVDYTPYEGFMIRGGVKHVLLRGNWIVKASEIVQTLPIGNYQHRQPRGKMHE
jgi:dihydropyrimidinase